MRKQKEAAVKQQQRDLAKQKKDQEKEKFDKCKKKYFCRKPGGKCNVTGFKECSSCHSILKSQCGKQECRGESGLKPEMIKYLLKKKITQLKKEYDSSTEEDLLSESETSDEEDSANEKNKIDIDPCDVIESS